MPLRASRPISWAHDRSAIVLTRPPGRPQPRNDGADRSMVERVRGPYRNSSYPRGNVSHSDRPPDTSERRGPHPSVSAETLARSAECNKATPPRWGSFRCIRLRRDSRTRRGSAKSGWTPWAMRHRREWRVFVKAGATDGQCRTCGNPVSRQPRASRHSAPAPVCCHSRDWQCGRREG
jgi:hypothetical protein